MSVRVRFAPSPTGRVHIGNIRVAIFNWLFARHAGGAFLLRIEDTDRERSTPDAVQAVFDALDWLAMDVDETPLYQSARREAHLAAADRLLRDGRAYRMDKGDTGKGECVMFRMPEDTLTFQDEIKGAMSRAPADTQDFVIVRTDGSPVFHLANVVDDIEMNVTHIIRGDDHVENTFRHVALFHALGATPPRYGHLPMIVNAQGKPYSKRDGDAFVGEFRDRGFLPDALFNFLALLGWSPGEDREVMTRADMIQWFGLDRVKSSPARMDMEKLAWMNGEYMRALPRETFRAAFIAALREAGVSTDGVPEAYLEGVVDLMQPRMPHVEEVAELSRYFFTEDFPFDEKAVRKRLAKPDALESLRELRQRFEAVEPWDADALEAIVRALAEERDASAGKLIHPVRVAVSGIMRGPGLFEMLELLGRARVLPRIDRALERTA